MTRPYRPYAPDQLLLLPPSLRDWVPEGDLSNFISDTIDALDLSGFYAGYRDDGKGEVPYDPRMMVKVLVYAYSVGVFSSRRIAQMIERDVAFRVLAAGNFPDHRTINRFRSANLEEFEKLFVEVIRVAREVGLVKLGTVAIDGSKVKANASKRKAMSYGRMKDEEQRLRKEIQALTRRAKEADVKEDRQYGKELRGDELPQELELRESRLKKIQEAKARLEARQREEDQKAGRKDGDHHKPKGQPGARRKRKFGEPEEKKQDNFTDPESRIMKTSAEGFQQCYNAQIAVDGEAHLIVATYVGNSAADNDYLLPVVDLVEENVGEQANEVLADSGYHSEQNFEGLQKRHIKGYISLGREGKAGRKIGANLKLTQAMARRLQGKRGKEKYRKRKCLAEPPFGWIKRVLGFRTFSLRGQRKARGEWSLVCLAANLRRLNQKMTWSTA